MIGFVGDNNCRSSEATDRPQSVTVDELEVDQHSGTTAKEDHRTPAAAGRLFL